MEVVEEGRIVEGQVESGTIALLNKAEIEQQIVTAHRFPRSLKQFRDEGLQMVTLTEAIAQDCIYALPRDGKTIEGPSARFAEIVASAWRNCRSGARVVDESDDFITAQGAFLDLERNVGLTYEVQRRIFDKNGRRFKIDMIGVTGNAACSIALRNAVLKGVPKAFWNVLYQAARKTVMGDFQTLANRRAEAIKQFVAFGVTEAMIYEKLGVAGKEDVGLEQLVVLAGLLTALKEGDTTVEDTFGKPAGAAGNGGSGSEKPAYPADTFEKNLKGWRDLITAGKKTAEQIIAMLQSKHTLTVEQKTAIQGGPTATAAPAVITALRKKIEDATLSEAGILKHLGVTSLDGITVAQVEKALAFVNNPMGEAQ